LSTLRKPRRPSGAGRTRRWSANKARRSTLDQTSFLNSPFGETTDHDFIRGLVMIQPTVHPLFFSRLGVVLDRIEELMLGHPTTGNREEFVEIQHPGFTA
jgi:hypothetical protein